MVQRSCSNEPVVLRASGRKRSDTGTTAAISKVLAASAVHGKSVTGLFLGYTLLPGGVWKGDFRVADLEHFAGLSLHSAAKGSECQVHVQRVPEVRFNTDEPIFYPLKAKYDLQRDRAASWHRGG